MSDIDEIILRLESNICAPSLFKDAVKALTASQAENKRLQAKIDELMFEYCPDDMTDPQIKEYQLSQRKVIAGVELDVEQALSNYKE